MFVNHKNKNKNVFNLKTELAYPCVKNNEECETKSDDKNGEDYDDMHERPQNLQKHHNVDSCPVESANRKR